MFDKIDHEVKQYFFRFHNLIFLQNVDEREIMARLRNNLKSGQWLLIHSLCTKIVEHQMNLINEKLLRRFVNGNKFNYFNYMNSQFSLKYILSEKVSMAIIKAPGP